MKSDIQKMVLRTERIEKNSGTKVKPASTPCPPAPKQKIKDK